MKRTFSETDQIAFARLSGDWNPLHVDALSARRTQFGTPVVHGVHLLLAALEAACGSLADDPPAATGTPTGVPRNASAPPRARLRKVEAVFERAVLVGREVDLEFGRVGEAAFELAVVAGTTRFARARVEFDGEPESACELPSPPIGSADACRDRGLDTLEGCSGAVDPAVDPVAFADRFPEIARRFGPGAPATILATSRLVGMECPGRQALLSSFTVSFGSGFRADRALRYRVSRVDRRFSLARLDLEGSDCSGRADAFVRPTSPPAPDLAVIRERVPAGRFRGVRALVVGGSRGLGEAAAKVLACGGARVCVTWNRGESDAARVVSEIAAAGGDAFAARLDALDAGAALPALVGGGFHPTHLYYFASPPIFVSDGAAFSDPLFAGFSDFYVRAFHALVSGLREQLDGPLEVYYPSTVAVATVFPGLAEYACAKAAGERLCAHLAVFHPRVTIRVSRLPRVRTDQTLTVREVAAEDAAEVMLRELVPAETRS